MSILCGKKKKCFFHILIGFKTKVIPTIFLVKFVALFLRKISENVSDLKEKRAKTNKRTEKTK